MDRYGRTSKAPPLGAASRARKRRAALRGMADAQVADRLRSRIDRYVRLLHLSYRPMVLVENERLLMREAFEELLSRDTPTGASDHAE